AAPLWRIFHPVTLAGPVRIAIRVGYASRASIGLAQHQGGGPVRTGEIAQRRSRQESSLDHVVRRLRTAGLVPSPRGGVGAYAIARRPEQITVGQIMR